MARHSASTKTVKSWISEYPNLSFDGVELLCNVCNVTISFTRKSAVTKHVSSRRHEILSGGCKQKLFNVDLLKFMVGCNIPWRQLDNPMFREFIENCVGGQYAEMQLPSSTTLRKEYLPRVAENIICNIRSELQGKYIWVSINETNACGRKIANVLVGALEELHATRGHLLASKELIHTNANGVRTLVNDSLKILWGDGYDANIHKFLLFITDTAAYMTAAGRMLQETYNFLHVTCLVDALHRVAETVRECYPKVDVLISSVKNAFHKAPERARLFCEIVPNTELPPEPVVTQWGTWIEAATYYFIYLEDVKQVLQQLQDSNQVVAISNTLEAVKDPTVQESVQEIHNFFSRIPLAIRQLERNSQTDRFSLIDEINVVYDLRQHISYLTGETAERVKQKLETVLESNPGFRTLSYIVKLLRKEEVDFDVPGIHESSLRKYSLFRYAPITCLDIERLVSLSKWIFSDKRRRLTPSHLEQIIIIYFYYSTAEYSE